MKHPSGGWATLFDDPNGELFSLLVETVRVDLHNAAEAVRHGDGPRLADLAHRLKGSAQLMGDADAVANGIAQCAALEDAAHSGDIARANSLLEQVTRTFDAQWRGRARQG